MASFNDTFRTDRDLQGPRPLRFTPAEWRALLKDGSFLDDDDNRFDPPRRFMGLSVEIVPDHSFG